jgi:hypothetical protein
MDRVYAAFLEWVKKEEPLLAATDNWRAGVEWAWANPPEGWQLVPKKSWDFFEIVADVVGWGDPTGSVQRLWDWLLEDAPKYEGGA